MDLFRSRPVRPADFPAALPLLAQDRLLFSAAAWQALPGTLTALLERSRIQGSVIVDAEGRICFCGVTTFVRTATAARLFEQPDPLRESLLRLEAAGARVMLGGRSLAAANADGDLALIHLFGCPDTFDFSSPRGFEIHRMGFEAFLATHGGYRLAELWQETVAPEPAEFVASMQVPEVRRIPLAGGAVARWFRFTRADSQTKPGNPLAQLMKFPAPRLCFTRAQQRLLELAIEEVSDRLAAGQFALTEAAIKKRWRTIYDRVERLDDRIAPAALSGAERRRMLLQYLRQHIEELRPWPQPAPIGNGK